MEPYVSAVDGTIRNWIHGTFCYLLSTHRKPDLHSTYKTDTMSRFTGVCHASRRHGGHCDVFRCSLPTDLTNTDECARGRQSEKELRSVSNQLLLQTHGWLLSIRIFLPHIATNVNYLAHSQNNHFLHQSNSTHQCNEDFLLFLHLHLWEYLHIFQKWEIFVKFHGFYDQIRKGY